MLIGEGGDLRKVGDAENLLCAAESLELLADGFGGAASDANVDFVEDQGARRSLSSGFRRRLFDGDFEGEKNAREFAPGGDFSEGFERLSGISGDAVFDFVPAGGGPLGFMVFGYDRNQEADFHGEGIDLGFGKLGELLPGGLAFGSES